MSQKKTFPDVIFIGPLKTATSYIYDYYLQHPDVVTTQPTKELFYYDDYYDKGDSWYLSHFSHQSEDKVRIDVSPSYMIRDVALQRIKKDNPNVKIVMTLRDPVERFNSHVKHHVRHGYSYDGFSNLIEEHPRIIRGSQYDQYVNRWISAFGENNVFILDFREFTENPQSFMKKTCDIIGVPFHAEYDFEHKVNAASVGSARNPLLMRLAHLTIRFMIRNGLSGIIETIKKAGGRKLVYKEAEAFDIPEEDKQLASQYLASSTRWYQQCFKSAG